MCWGRWLGDLPEGEFVQVYAGSPSCALDTGGELVCWGGVERRSLPDAPAGSFSMVSVAAGPGSGLGFGADYACGLRTSGEIACWAASFGQGSNFGQADPPEGSFVSVSAGAERACVIDADGRAVCWGNSEFQPDPAKERWGWIVNNYHCYYRRGYDYDPPAGPVDCTIYRDFRDGTAIFEEITEDDPYWDSEEFWGVYGGVADPLRGPFVQISVGGAICGVRADAAVVCWSGLWGPLSLGGVLQRGGGGGPSLVRVAHSRRRVRQQHRLRQSRQHPRGLEEPDRGPRRGVHPHRGGRQPHVRAAHRQQRGVLGEE